MTKKNRKTTNNDPIEDKTKIIDEKCSNHCVDEEDKDHKILELTADLAATSDKLMRTLAEIQNTKRIAEREKADILKYGISKFAKDILSIRDTLKLALTNMIDDNPIVVGIKQTMNMFDKVLKNYNIVIIESENCDFNPHYHQAILEVESDLDVGKIVQVMQDGFMIEDRLLRPALVTVSKGKNNQNK